MIQKVHRGQKLTTGLVNGIIDQANGQQIPSTGQFTNTEKGTLYIEENNIVYDFQPDIKDKFLQCKVDYVPSLKARPFDYEKDDNGNVKLDHQILINLGTDRQSAVQSIKVNGFAVKEIILIGFNPDLDVCLTDEMLNPMSQEENKIMLFNDGYVNTTLRYSPTPAESTESNNEAIEIYGEVYEIKRGNPSGDDGSEGNADNATAKGEYYYVICDGKEEYKERIKTAIQKHENSDDSESGGESTDGDPITSVRRVERKRIMLCTPDYNGINSYVQNVIGSQDIMIDKELLTDVEVSEEGYVDADGRQIKEYSIDHLVAIEKTTDDAGNEVENYHDYFSLRNFWKGNSIILTSVADYQKYDFLVRKEDVDGSQLLQYVEIGPVLISGDVETTDVFKSICVKEEGSTPYYQLYNWTYFPNEQEGEYTKKIGFEETSEYNVLVRHKSKNSANPEVILEYVELSALSSTLETDTDYLLLEDQIQKSIQKIDDGSQEYLQLYNFDNPDTVYMDENGLLAYDVLVRKDSILQYARVDIGLSNYVKKGDLVDFVVETDTDATGSQCSIEKIVNSGDEEYLQLYNFDDSTTIDVNDESLKNYDVLVRDGTVLKYAKLDLSATSCVTSSEVSTIVETIIEEKDLSVKVDNKSINYNNNDELQVYNFADNQSMATNLADVLEGDQSSPGEILVRSNGVVDYMPIGTLTGGGGDTPTQITVEDNTILGYELEYNSSYEITLKRGRLVIENNVLKLVPDDTLTQKIATTPISEITQ